MPWKNLRISTNVASISWEHKEQAEYTGFIDGLECVMAQPVDRFNRPYSVPQYIGLPIPEYRNLYP